CPSPVGPLPGGQTGLGVAFGRLKADDLRTLACVRDLRVTPWRTLIVTGSAGRGAFVTDPDDPLMRVQACVGPAGCARAGGDVEGLARALAPPWRGGLLHVSGCAKRCAHPGQADVTWVAHDGRYDGIDARGRSVPGWDGRTAEQVRALMHAHAQGDECP
ncbi:precorrin-3B synthase, partial [Ameyamaea chiangmaiensis]|nr:precorrin-3B synthase [Ameyamaea chiangmaiensis]